MGNDLIKSNPKTIADLNINWEFSHRTYLDFGDFVDKFEKLNSNVKNYIIIPNIYNFTIINNNPRVSLFKNDSYIIDTKKLNFSKICNLFELFFELDFLIAVHSFKNNGDYLKIDSIEKASNYQFVIYLK